jgi:MFS family permease
MIHQRLQFKKRSRIIVQPQAVLGTLVCRRWASFKALMTYGMILPTLNAIEERSMATPLRSLLLFLTLSLLLSLSLFYRVSNAVIAPNLTRDLGLTAETLGLLGGAFFYSFALLQIPIGPMLDRLSPRFVVTFFPLLGALGAILFGLGPSYTTVLIGRILNGMGMSCVLMGSLKIFTLWFPADRFATLMGTLLSIGTLGNILAASPLAFFASTIGWRMTFIVAGALTAILALLVFCILGGKREGAGPAAGDRAAAPEIGLLSSARLILGSLSFWQTGVVIFFRYGTFVGLQGLWLGPYLMDIRGYSPMLAGNLLILIAVGTIAGGPIAGKIADRGFLSRKGVALWGLSFYALSLLLLTGVFHITSPLWYAVIFFFMGLFNSFGIVIYSQIKESFPISISGTVMAWINFFSMVGGAVLMPVLGGLIESFPRVNGAYPAEAYSLSFVVCFLGMAASLIFYGLPHRTTRPMGG